MICPNCQSVTSRIIMRSGQKACAKCWGLSEAAGARIDGTLTRSSSRIRDQQRTHEGDIIMPHVFDPVTKQLKPNEDFIKQHPDKIATNYTPEELKKAGHSKVDQVFKQHSAEKAAHAAEYDRGVTYRRQPKTDNK